MAPSVSFDVGLSHAFAFHGNVLVWRRWLSRDRLSLILRLIGDFSWSFIAVFGRISVRIFVSLFSLNRRRFSVSRAMLEVVLSRVRLSLFLADVL